MGKQNLGSAFKRVVASRFQEMILGLFLGVFSEECFFLFEECLETLRLDSRNTSPEYTLRGKEEQKRCKEDLHSHLLISF